MSIIDSLYFGKQCEYRIFSELLKCGYDVYVPLLDNKGVDCIAEKENKKYKIQVKGRSSKSKWVYNFHTSSPSADYHFLITPSNDVYLIPNTVIKRWLNGKVKFDLQTKARLDEAKKYKQRIKFDTEEDTGELF